MKAILLPSSAVLVYMVTYKCILSTVLKTVDKIYAFA